MGVTWERHWQRQSRGALGHDLERRLYQGVGKVGGHVGFCNLRIRASQCYWNCQFDVTRRGAGREFIWSLDLGIVVGEEVLERLGAFECRLASGGLHFDGFVRSEKKLV
jgi:hypothetical protein